MTVHPLPQRPAATYTALRDRYLRKLAVEGLAPRTLHAYQRDLDETMEHVAAAHHTSAEHLDLATVTNDDLVDALDTYLHRADGRYHDAGERGAVTRARATMARRISALRGFFAWAHATGRIPADPANLLRPPRQTTRAPVALDERDAHTALATPAVGDGVRWPQRDFLIMALGLCFGLRPGEIAALPEASIDPAAPQRGVTILGKGGRQRHIPVVPPTVCVAVAAYLPTRAARLRRAQRRAASPLLAGTLVLSTRTRATADGTLTIEPTEELISYVVERVLTSVCNGARGADMGPHALRRTFATLAARSGAQMRAIQVLLGHADIRTTQRYVQVADDDLTAALRTHPLAG